MKKITSLVLALVMLMSLCVTAFAAGNDGYADPDADTGENADIVWNFTGADENLNELDEDEELPLVTSFKDVKSSAWYYKDVMECAKLGIVAGFEDGSFKPENKVTSVQLIVMLTRTFYNNKLEAAKKNSAGGTWYAPNAAVAADVGMSNGLTLNDNAMNRYDMAKALYNVISSEGKKSGVTTAQLAKAINSIKDWSSVPKNRQGAVKYCYALGIITGMEDGTFAGSQSMTRAQACTVIIRMMKLISNYNPGDKDNNQYDDGKNQDTGNTGNNQQTGTGKLANGKDATVANVQEILNQLRHEWPEGTRWAATGTANNNYYANGGQTGSDIRTLKNQIGNPLGATSLNYACGGFMSMISDKIFGTTGAPTREVIDIKNARPGDILALYDKNGNFKHACILLTVDKPYANEVLGGMTYNITSVDGNIIKGSNPGIIDWDYPGNIWNNFGSANYNQYAGCYYRCFTRYPA